MSIDELLDSVFGKRPEVKIERLHPPKPTMREIALKRLEPVSSQEIDMEQKWDQIKNLLTFRRFIIDSIKIFDPAFSGIDTRLSKVEMNRVMNERIELVQDLQDIARGSKKAMKGVMKEFKEKVRRIQEK